MCFFFFSQCKLVYLPVGGIDMRTPWNFLIRAERKVLSLIALEKQTENQRRKKHNWFRLYLKKHKEKSLTAQPHQHPSDQISSWLDSRTFAALGLSSAPAAAETANMMQNHVRTHFPWELVNKKTKTHDWFVCRRKKKKVVTRNVILLVRDTSTWAGRRAAVPVLWSNQPPA